MSSFILPILLAVLGVAVFIACLRSEGVKWIYIIILAVVMIMIFAIGVSRDRELYNRYLSGYDDGYEAGYEAAIEDMGSTW